MIDNSRRVAFPNLEQLNENPGWRIISSPVDADAWRAGRRIAL